MRWSKHIPKWPPFCLSRYCKFVNLDIPMKTNPPPITRLTIPDDRPYLGAPGATGSASPELPARIYELVWSHVRSLVPAALPARAIAERLCDRGRLHISTTTAQHHTVANNVNKSRARIGAKFENFAQKPMHYVTNRGTRSRPNSRIHAAKALWYRRKKREKGRRKEECM